MAEVALQYNDGYSEIIVSFANNIHTPEGGMHEEGFKRALTTVLNNYGKKMKILKDDEKVSGDDCREGLTCVISVKLTEAQFEGQTKAKLGNSEIRTLVNAVVTEKLAEFLEENPTGGQGDPGKGHDGQPRPGGCPQGPGGQSAARTRWRAAAMPDKLQRLQRDRPRPHRALHRRGRLRRRLRQAAAGTAGSRPSSPCGARC